MRRTPFIGAILLFSVSISLMVGADRAAAQGPAGNGAAAAAQDSLRSLNPLNWIKKDSKNSTEAPGSRSEAEKKPTIAVLLLAGATSGQTPHQPTFLGHWLGETYDEFLKAKVGTIDPAPYISGPCNGANDDPSSCLADPLIINGRSAVVVVHNGLEITFVFTDNSLVEMHTDGCGEGSGQATLLTARFGRPSEVVRTPYQNGFGARWVNTKWMWHLSPNIELYVEEDRSPVGESCPSEPFVYISFSRPEPKKKVVNPYSQPRVSKSGHNPISA